MKNKTRTPIGHDYQSARNLYGTIIVAQPATGSFRMLDEPTYMDWQDKRDLAGYRAKRAHFCEKDEEC